ncbi:MULTISPECIES: RNA-guided endonuclease InsQ/TnpB family protein [unclassified Mycolicibacterium]|uniref:RNA-guided endonuclease InsQ/TnpB family protein n=1 Tax=unclassified Mycolicibacterium TaxID=2636767 RepID=UPI002EDAD468
MRRAYVFRLRPTARQYIALNACLDAHRELYNAALQERRDAWAHNKTRINYGAQSAQLSEIRRVRSDQGVWSFSSQQATLRRLNKAFDGFFRRVKAGQTPGYPRFKGKARFHSVGWPKDGDGARWLPDQQRVYLQGIGQVKVTVHRRVQGRVKTIAVKRLGQRWMLVLSCDDVPANPLPATGAQVGIDLGVLTYATMSDGTAVENPRWARQAAAQLEAAQQRLTRAKRGSNDRRRKRETVAARHRKIANRRKDFHHKQAGALVARYDLIVVEDLAITNMLRRAKPKPDSQNPGQFLPNGAAAKSGLNRSISDAGWGQFVSILRAKAEDAGRTWIEVDPRHTSDRCESCRHAAPENRVSQAAFVCQRCGHAAPADEHAARNILRAGLAHHAHTA